MTSRLDRCQGPLIRLSGYGSIHLLMLCERLTNWSAERIVWGEAVMLKLAYKHPRTGKRTQIRQAVRIACNQPFELKVGRRASVVC